MNECEVILLCLNPSLYVLPASSGMRAFPRLVPGASGMPGGSKWDLLWRPVPHLGQLPMGAISVLGRQVPNVPRCGNSLLISKSSPAPLGADGAASVRDAMF